MSSTSNEEAPSLLNGKSSDSNIVADNSTKTSENYGDEIEYTPVTLLEARNGLPQSQPYFNNSNNNNSNNDNNKSNNSNNEMGEQITQLRNLIYSQNNKISSLEKKLSNYDYLNTQIHNLEVENSHMKQHITNLSRENTEMYGYVKSVMTIVQRVEDMSRTTSDSVNKTPLSSVVCNEICICVGSSQ
jgi:TolA-binding protein